MIWDSFVKITLRLFKPLTVNLSLKATRKVQDNLEKPLLFVHKAKARFSYEKNCVVAVPDTVCTNKVGLYFHGGAYTAGGEKYVRGVSGVLSANLSMKIYGCVYPLAPENPYPAAVDDAFSSYCMLLDKGISPKDICLFGESAGGGIVFALCDMIKSNNLPMPSCIINMSPWCDLTFRGESFITNKKHDPNLSEKQLKKSAQMYMGDVPPQTPRISPVYMDTTGFPPTLMFVGRSEILLSDSCLMRNNLLCHNVKCYLHIEKDMWHIYPLYKTKTYKETFGTIKEFTEKWN